MAVSIIEQLCEEDVSVIYFFSRQIPDVNHRPIAALQIGRAKYRIFGFETILSHGHMHCFSGRTPTYSNVYLATL